MTKDFWSDKTVGVVGSGSWATALAHLLSHKASHVRMLFRNAERANTFEHSHQNQPYFGNKIFSSQIHAVSTPEKFFAGGLYVVVWAIPSSVSRSVARVLAPFFEGPEILIHSSKGMEFSTFERMSQVLLSELPIRKLGVLSGPNFAREVIENKPTCMVLASPYQEVRDSAKQLLSLPFLQVSEAVDIEAVEWAGIFKNVMAILSGALFSKPELGENFRATFFTRALRELSDFGAALELKQSVFYGPAGLGDLIVTCGSSMSRNFRIGAALAEGYSLEEAQKRVGETAEGVATCFALNAYAFEKKMILPLICGAKKFLLGECSVEELVHIVLHT